MLSSLKEIYLILSLLFNNPRYLRVEIFLMLFRIFSCICIISIAGRAEKVSKSANYRAHCLAKWAVSHLVFGSIP
jgi:hypothetical protein